MKKIIIVAILLLGFNANAQDFLVGPTISYQSQAGNLLKVGGYYLQPMAGDSFGLKLEANAQFAYFRDAFRVIPEGSVTFYPTFDNLILPFVEGELTPYTVTPKVGLTFATIMDIAVGYGFDTKIKEGLKPIKGFTFSLGFNIPLNAF
ncbi:hypothetical protein H1R17_08480 [Flavobacterium sp. xlx-214]|uniref:hypothetical protein n=1 Tax=unclassified Flavobacterium TaxID=196869 RepID=UPI0013D16B3B|nr:MULTISPECIES: hypothetical protein [unclassified Flavobacterium]MBA5793199.1 hypothetical protein [Flavobacterium sp. xlx-221]QMI82518.1 hypothetical protein H1R17_08480 [Flavobacterium sp. xlx-214]